MKDLNRIRKACDAQARMNILRKHQVKLLNKFLERLLEEKRITKQELKEFMPRKKQAEKIVFKPKN